MVVTATVTSAARALDLCRQLCGLRGRRRGRAHGAESLLTPRLYRLSTPKPDSAPLSAFAMAIGSLRSTFESALGCAVYSESPTVSPTVT